MKRSASSQGLGVPLCQLVVLPACPIETPGFYSASIRDLPRIRNTESIGINKPFSCYVCQSLLVAF